MIKRTKAIILDETGQRMATALEQLATQNDSARMAAEEAAQYVEAIEEAMDSLPDGQAVSAEVAQLRADVDNNCAQCGEVVGTV